MSLVDCPILVDMAKPGDIQHSPWVTLLMFILVKIVMVAMEVMVVIYSAGVYYVNPGGPLPPLSITKPSPANPPTLNNTIFVLVKILSIGVLVNSYPELVCVVHKQNTKRVRAAESDLGSNQTRMSLSWDVGTLQHELQCILVTLSCAALHGLKRYGIW